MNQLRSHSLIRLAIALLVAPLVAVASILAILFAVTTLGSAPVPQPAELFLYWWNVFAAFGLPVAYALSIGIGIPAYLVLTRYGLLRTRYVLGVAVLTGAIAMPVVAEWYIPDLLPWYWWALTGAVMGAAAGAVVALVLTRRVVTA